MKSLMTAKQKKFCAEYLKDTNATQAAIRAGYSKKSARQIGDENLSKPYIRKYIDEMLEDMQSQKIASAEEVLEYLTSVMRGQATSEEVVTAYVGGSAEARKIEKKPSEKDKLKAAELLGKTYGIYTDKLKVTATVPVFKGEEDLED